MEHFPFPFFIICDLSGHSPNSGELDQSPLPVPAETLLLVLFSTEKHNFLAKLHFGKWTQRRAVNISLFLVCEALEGTAQPPFPSHLAAVCAHQLGFSFSLAFNSGAAPLGGDCFSRDYDLSLSLVTLVSFQWLQSCCLREPWFREWFGLASPSWQSHPPPHTLWLVCQFLLHVVGELLQLLFPMQLCRGRLLHMTKNPIR